MLPNAPTFVSTLTNLFKDIALAVEENEEVLAEDFGPGALPRAVLELHAECDARGAQILRRFIEHRQIARVAQLVGRRGTGEPLPDPRQVEALLEEMLLLCQRSEEYNAFMLAKLNAGSQPSGGLSPAAANTFKTGQFNRAVHEMVGHYIGLEEYYLIENVSKAIRIDEHVPGSMTSSMVDDVFYILMSSGRRAGATGSLQCVCAVINHINNLLSNEFDHALQGKVRTVKSGSEKFDSFLHLSLLCRRACVLTAGSCARVGRNATDGERRVLCESSAPCRSVGWRSGCSRPQPARPPASAPAPPRRPPPPPPRAPRRRPPPRRRLR